MKVNWTGVYPAVTTKFNSDYKLDLKACQASIDAQIKAGVSGIVLGGTLGEASVLSAQEKDQLFCAAKEVTKNEVPLILNIAEQTTENAVYMVKHAEKLGIDGFMLLPPMRYAPDNYEALCYLGTVAIATELPIMIYNNPVDYKTEVTLDMFDKLSRYENIRAVKESTRDVTNVTRMINRFGDRFKILCGVDTIAMESLVMGADGWVAGLVCAFPQETVMIFNLIKEGNINQAREIFRWFLPLLELDIHPKLVQYIKLAESFTGLGNEIVRPPRLPLIGEERERIISIIKGALDKRPVLKLQAS
jgi:4-hydroxy-tetrahydrodipicolinate synthase